MNTHFGCASLWEVWPLINTFHYSRRMPSNVQHCFVLRQDGGLFGEHGEIIAACIFSIPGTRWKESVLELSRLVKKDGSDSSCSSLISKSTRWLKRTNADLLVSFADNTQGHHGGVYQAASWNYAGCRKRSQDGATIDGKFVPGRSLNSRFGTRSIAKLRLILKNHHVAPHYDEGKHLYWKSLNRFGDARAKRLSLLCFPYPKPQRGLSSGHAHPMCTSLEHTQEAAPLLMDNA